MSCKHFEEWLPAYAENDLAPEERSRIDAHLETCQSCRESLAFFTQLEDDLASRRSLRPSDTVAASRITARLGVRPRRRFVAALTGLPAAISGGLILFGIIMFLARDIVQDLVTRVAAMNFGEDFGNRLSETTSAALGSIAVGSEWTWVIAYLGVFALILFSGSWMVLRHLRHS